MHSSSLRLNGCPGRSTAADACADAEGGAGDTWRTMPASMPNGTRQPKGPGAPCGKRSRPLRLCRAWLLGEVFCRALQGVQPLAARIQCFACGGDPPLVSGPFGLCQIILKPGNGRLQLGQCAVGAGLGFRVRPPPVVVL